MSYVNSKDGTALGYERIGSGPALILVDGALCCRAFGPMPKLATLLAEHFTVYIYDRRGRGESGDKAPPGSHVRERELEDLAALIGVAGGSAYAAGLSSGGALALQAAADGLPLRRVIAYEPPYVEADNSTRGVVHLTYLQKLIARDDRAAAVKYFLGPMVGAPAPAIVMMQLMFWVWPKLKAVAHTLPYDAAVMGDFTVPKARLAEIRIPTLLLHGGKTDERLARAALSATSVIANAEHKVLQGQTHNVSSIALLPALLEFFNR